MIPKILADRGEVGHRRDPQCGELVSCSDAGAHQDRRATVRAGGEHDLVGLDELAICEQHTAGPTIDDLDAIDEHIEVTERPEGLYDEILHRAPRLSSQVDRLRAEHSALRDGTAKLIERLHSTAIGEGWPLEEARDDAQRLLGKIVKHRQQGADLVWGAYNLDIGGIE